jgi:hypothetical protein
MPRQACRSSAPAVPRQISAAQSQSPSAPTSNPPGPVVDPFADPKLLTPAERLAAFGRLFARAIERRRSRSRHFTSELSKQ